MSLLQIGKRRKNPPMLLDRIYLSMSSEGYGHSSRGLAIARQFHPSEVLMGTYGYALKRVQAYGYPTVEVAQELKFVGSEGQFDVGRTILYNPTKALAFNQIVQDEIDIIKRNAISLVVADGRMAPVLAAERLDLPCLVLTNQSAFYPFFERDSALVKLFGRSFEWVMKLWLSSAEEILIPDFPPPLTVCLPNLSTNYQVKKRTRFVGPLVAWQAHEITPIPRSYDRPLIVASLGGHEYRRPLFDAVIEAARYMPNIDFKIISGFRAIGNIPQNVEVHNFVNDAAAYFKAADLVITQAGHSTAMELLTLGKPCLIVPDHLQIEQENNAARMAELGVGLTMQYDELEDGRQAKLRHTIQTLLNTRAFQEKAEEIAAVAAEIHGAANAARILREYAHRLSAY